VLVVLPGSRTSEVTRLMQPFGEALELLHARRIRPQVIIPAVAHVRPLIERLAQSWTVQPHLVEGEDDKFRAFRLAHAALAASGTVTLQLALAGTPMVVAYKVDGIAAHLRFLLNVPSVVLANLVLEENAFPELLQEDCTPEKLADALEPLLRDSPERRAQLAALARIPHKMLLDGGTPSDAAADIVLDYAVHGRRPE
jgi:lipid-A-disaccharide synthase